ncbi:TetR/AcrR family transcriptional regulator [Microbulbifer thermotolerans]|uniref:TetR/AcrR family transcriptional regulator n=1 Tax=Microbulbifer thermotolerans TaxID=252514 RepID=UPI00224AD679|nr:TetR/AcrR family transcriptional regulator [Microbulbifer thermotolerans]MCX2781244.1 TetR/AcrR family transcriptional regulator [Microbulbifer thermotolerans]MCX2803727.1 TetR/AcrR family transcriptional regulator [Microbulbifer thermotolerans]MCX2834956.1 TetR/AcrR family transcriptional regulator [Microbulbifer thermotolerans]MCX2840655.1 TetR/AcrR family transcriptional regulator [Microbulbifer thermotolerans]
MPEPISAPVPRGRPKDPAKRRAILEAAKGLFLTQGFAGTSMDAVASAAGVSKLTVYSHFSDKETLFTAAIEAKCENQMPLPIFALENGDSIEQVLRRIGTAFLSLVEGEDAISLMRILCAESCREMAQLYLEAGPRRTLSEMESLLRRAVALKLLRVENPAAAADQFFGMLMGCRHMQVLVDSCAPPSECEIRERVDEVVQVFLRAYGP